MKVADVYEKSVDITRRTSNICIEALFPSRCIGCGMLGTHLCPTCLSRVESADIPPFPDTYAVWSYRDTLAHTILWKLKYRSQTALADVAAKALTDILTEIIADITLMESTAKPLLVPIPLFSAKEKERGYNQSALIVQALAQRLDSTENGNGILIKTHETQSQMATKTRKTRLENLRGAFAVSNPAHVTGRVVIVIDDVTTTGATFAEARRALKDAGAKKIICCAVAH
ncbi:MAG: ComF family protein [Parcubacteria group bacterium]|nr:ComF family protein [Parcubacteria group bacterium]